MRVRQPTAGATANGDQRDEERETGEHRRSVAVPAKACTR
jgi:hypothetical protein